MNPSAMKQAIRHRRGQGLEISILVGSPEDKKNTDLAPPGKHPEGQMPPAPPSAHEMPMAPEPEMPPSAPPEANKMAPEAAEEGHDEEIQNHILNGSSPDEPMGHAPRSLGDRAKMALMAKMKMKNQHKG